MNKNKVEITVIYIGELSEKDLVCKIMAIDAGKSTMVISPAQQSGDGWVWTDALACEWAGYLESKMVYSSVQHIPQLLAQWKASKIQQPPSNP